MNATKHPRTLSSVPDTPAPKPDSDHRVPDQREDQPLKKINDPHRSQKLAGQDLRDPQEHDDAK